MLDNCSLRIVHMTTRLRTSSIASNDGHLLCSIPFIVAELLLLAISGLIAATLPIQGLSHIIVDKSYSNITHKNVHQIGLAKCSGGMYNIVRAECVSFIHP